MDRYITATEANQRFSEMLRDVADGESFVVTSRGKPLARIARVDAERRGGDVTPLLDYLRGLPSSVIGPWSRDDLYRR